MKSIFEIEGELLPFAELKNIDETILYDYLSAYKKAINDDVKSIKMLEIGVGIGCHIPVFAKVTADIQSIYIGIDINAQSLAIACEIAKICKLKLDGFDYALIEGNSNILQIQRTLTMSGPYDIIHIAGNPNKKIMLKDLEFSSKCLTDYGIVIVGNYDNNDTKFSVDYAKRMKWFSEIERINNIAILFNRKKVSNNREKKNIEYKPLQEKIYTGTEKFENSWIEDNENQAMI